MKGTPMALWGNALKSIIFAMVMAWAGIAGAMEDGAMEKPEWVVIQGVVLGLPDSTAVPGVHVLNPIRGVGTTTNVDGQFAMRVKAGDEIRFTAIGFESTTLTVTDSLVAKEERLIIVLTDKIYDLPTVEVRPYATFTEFKYAFLNFKDPDPPLDLNLPEVQAHYDPRDPGEMVSVTAPGPISVLYDHFSRREKEKRQYQEVLAQEELARKAKRVINPTVVKNLTGIDNEEEYYAFLRFCNMSNEYIVHTREYEVYERLRQCFAQYAMLKEQE